jgi:hypothetical protein
MASEKAWWEIDDPVEAQKKAMKPPVPVPAQQALATIQRATRPSMPLPAIPDPGNIRELLRRMGRVK